MRGAKYAAGLAWCGLIGWFAFVRGKRVPLLGLVDLGFHELGHLLTYPLPDLLTAMAGSVTQVLVPLGLAAYFLVARHDSLGGAICLAWAGAAAQDASVYIADGPYEQLELIGGEHDWAFALGPEGLDVLEHATGIAATVKVGGLLLLLGGATLCLAGLARELRPARVPQPPRAPAAGWPRV